MKYKFYVLFCLAGLTSCESMDKPKAEQGPQISQEGQEVREQIQLYVDSINHKDIDKMADFWLPEAVYKNPITGELVQGKEGMKRELAKVLDTIKNENAQVEYIVEEVRFPSEGKAASEGFAVISLPTKQPVKSDFKMIHVKQNGKWLISHVSRLDFGSLKDDQK